MKDKLDGEVPCIMQVKGCGPLSSVEKAVIMICFIDLQSHLGVFQVTSSAEQFAVFVENEMNLKVFMLHHDVLEIDMLKIKDSKPTRCLDLAGNIESDFC